jgi:uncharacterized membrane protein (UPF0182 family)
MAIMTTLSVAGLYLFRFLIVGFDPAANRQSKIHLSLLLVVVVLVFTSRYWLNQFELNFSTSGVVFGATYTDVHARLPFLYIGMALGVATAAVLAVSAFRAGITLPLATVGAWVAVMLIGGLVYPASVQRFSVQPNELERERTYIERNIEMTRAAFGLDGLEERPFPAAPEVTFQEVSDNACTSSVTSTSTVT